MPDPISLPSDDVIRSVVGTAAFMRGCMYAQEGRVERLQVSPQRGAIFARVHGAAAEPYTTMVVVDDAQTISARCTCPVGSDCKHAVAALIAARDAAAPLTAGWRATLDEVVRAHSTDGRTRRPLGLQFELIIARSRLVPERIVLQPVTTGHRERWVKSGAPWQGFLSPGTGFVAEQHEALRRLYLAATSTLDGRSPGAGIELDRFGPALWQLLAEARQSGVVLVGAGRGLETVRLADAPATATMDLVRDDDRLSVRPVVRIGDQKILPGDLHFVGTPAHGLYRLDGEVLELAGLESPLRHPVTRLFADGASIDVPDDESEGFWHDYFPTLRQVVTVGSSDGSVELPEPVVPVIGVQIMVSTGPRASLRWSFRYAAEHETRRFALGGVDGSDVRDRRAERELLVRATRIVDGWPALLGRDGLLAATATLTGPDALGFAQDAVPILRDEDIDVAIDGAPERLQEAAETPLVMVSTADTEDTDWFDLRVQVSIAGEKVPFDALFAALVRGDSHLILDSGTYFPIDQPELRRLRELIEEAQALTEAPESGELRISRFQAGLWEELVELGVVETQSAMWRRSVDGLLELDTLEAADPPPSVKAQLRPYQRDGFGWVSFLYEHQLGGILADDMGLGKTLQTLAAVANAHDDEALASPFLVVAPTSVVQNWAAEAARFTPGLEVRTIAETEARRGVRLADVVEGAQIVVTSYALFRIEFDAYDELDWAGLVLDEAQFVKNRRAKSYQCARRLRAPFKLAITGTPLENSLMDLWSMLSIVAPGLFPDPERFREQYRNPIEREGDSEALARLRRRVRPLMRRRTKEQVAADLPPKQEQVLELDLGSRHRAIYQTRLQRERQKILGLLDDLDQNRFTILQSLTVLRQLSLDPYLVDEQYAGIGSSKVDALVEQLTELAAEGHRALVFSQFTRYLARVRERLGAEGISYSYLDGSTANRGKVVEGFKQGSDSAFLISLKAGGFGLNLTEADYCFVLDPWWNPAVEQQAIDRTHRIGQHKTVMVYRLVARDTIEEKVMELKARKRQLFSRVLDDEAGELSAPLSVSDIRGLLGME